MSWQHRWASGIARSQTTPGHCMHCFTFFLVSGGRVVLAKAASLESGVVLTHDFSIRALSTGLHQY